ncbi:hypothetical protein AZA_35044 [Nitrospirillum viridazoti Y2]|nr:hypothetical protein AZA_35044 [Nitrospirillum amazonense Y2]
MTIPRLQALKEVWAARPSLRQMVGAYLGIKDDPIGPSHPPADQASFEDFYRAMTGSLPPG